MLRKSEKNMNLKNVVYHEVNNTDPLTVMLSILTAAAVVCVCRCFIQAYV